MEEMYQTHKAVAEFRLVYIKEAHPADSRRAVGYALELGITTHDNYSERCTTADMLLKAKGLTIPFVVDGIENAVSDAYIAFPDRVFLVRRDGRIAIAAERGPRGFSPALRQAKKWLEEFSQTGTEPRLPDDAQEPGEDRRIPTAKKGHRDVGIDEIP